MNRQMNLVGAVTVVLLVVGLIAANALFVSVHGAFSTLVPLYEGWPCKWYGSF